MKLELGFKKLSGLAKPLVSVLIPAFNHAVYIEECLSSVAASDYPHIEVLVIDDGSADKTYAHICNWRSRRGDAFVRFVASSRMNRGLNATLNELVQASQGELICLLGSDDRLLPMGISARVTALIADAKLSAVFGDCNVIDETGDETHESGFDLNRADVVALSDPSTMATELVWRWSVPGPVLMMRREVFFSPDGYGFYPEGRKVEDREFYLWALSRGRLGFVNAKVASYRIHSTNMSRLLSVLTEAENKEAEWLIAACFPPALRAGLTIKYLLYRLQVKAAAYGVAGRLILKIAKSLDWRITSFVLTRNSRRARADARCLALASRTMSSAGVAAAEAASDRGASCN